MDLPVNHNTPLLMHIDLNSCFATFEQQAFPRLRGKPLVIAAYDSPRGCVIAPSIEAKQHGITVGMTVSEAKVLCPEVVVRMPDPPKYRAVHSKFAKIFRDYSDSVTPKSIDEAVIDFSRMNNQVLRVTNLANIGHEIKRRMKREIGVWMRCNVGIGTNRFLAKTAASLHKPDGLDVITHQNLEQVYQSLTLTAICGINTRYQARLNAARIFTPMQFLHASCETLQKQVFQSIAGYYWYLRLRGWEIDDVKFKRKSIGQMYALGKETANIKELSKLLMKLIEKMGRRLRRLGLVAWGIHVGCVYADQTYSHLGRTFDHELYTTNELYRKVLYNFTTQFQGNVVTHLSVACLDLKPVAGVQESIFDTM
jgi:DNA polymerase IV